MIRGLFGGAFGGRRDEGADLPAERGPLRLAIGHAVEIDTLSLQADMTGAEPAMGPPDGGPFVVAAHGKAAMDADTELHRYYDARHRMLQVLAAPGGDEADVMDVSLYLPWDSVAPMGRAEWDRWTGPDGLIGAPDYDADGIHFDRYWGEGEGHAPLVEFVEEVDDGEARRSIHQRCMLYARPLGRVEEMLLINVERDLADRSREEGASVEFLIGYGLGPADVRRV